MQFDYQMTIEDFREASASKNPAAKPRKPLQTLLGWLPLFLLCVFWSLPRDLLFRALNPRGSFPFQTQPEQNLWVTLAPSLCITTLLSTPSALRVWNAYKARRAKAAGRKAKPSVIVAKLLTYLSMVWIIPVIWPPFAIQWTPSDGQALAAAFAPWMLYFAVIGYAAGRRRNRTVDDTWAKRTTLHRRKRLEFSAEGFSTDDGVVSQKYTWAHFKRFGETQNLLLLVTEDEITLFFAKRAIPDDAAMDEVRMLIHENIVEGEFTTKANAFPVILPVAELAPDA